MLGLICTKTCKGTRKVLLIFLSKSYKTGENWRMYRGRKICLSQFENKLFNRNSVRNDDPVTQENKYTAKRTTTVVTDDDR